MVSTATAIIAALLTRQNKSGVRRAAVTTSAGLAGMCAGRFLQLYVERPQRSLLRCQRNRRLIEALRIKCDATTGRDPKVYRELREQAAQLSSTLPSREDLSSDVRVLESFMARIAS